MSLDSLCVLSCNNSMVGIEGFESFTDCCLVGFDSAMFGSGPEHRIMLDGVHGVGEHVIKPEKAATFNVMLPRQGLHRPRTWVTDAVSCQKTDIDCKKPLKSV